jgi:ppGpp synthetase/RelA/SpoT-type nucleotidyltranferase
MAKTPPASGPTYDDFEKWYVSHVHRVLDPGRKSIVGKLNSILDENLSERDRAQVRVVGDGRTKATRRTWNKLNREKYRSQFRTPDNAITLIDDLIGIRITCNNLADQRRVVNVLAALPIVEKLDLTEVLAVQRDSDRPYVTQVKESGYRAHHLNLLAWVEVGLSRVSVTAELQIRTVLQDAWGELTHEDTYNSSEIPTLARPLTRRLADLLAILDDIAEDIRKELDRLDSSTDVPELAPQQGDNLMAQFESAAEVLRKRIASAVGPADLASLAYFVRREVGSTEGWFGCASFKTFLKKAIPDVRLHDYGPSYVIPSNYDGPLPGADTESNLVSAFEAALE